LAIALAVTGLPAAVSSAALACSRRVNDTTAGSYSGFGLVPAGACGGTPRSTSTMCRSHHNASAATASGMPSSGVEDGSGGRDEATAISNPSLISNWARLISVTTPLPAASRNRRPRHRDHGLQRASQPDPVTDRQPARPLQAASRARH